MPQPSLNELVSKMNGRDSTNKWDVVVSYSAEQLNSFLKTAYAGNKLVSKVVLNSRTYIKQIKKYYEDTYTINLQAPTIEFLLGQRGMARLVMPIGEGSTYETKEEGTSGPGEVTKLPAGKYSVVATVPLAVISGDKKVADQGTVVNFTSNNVSDHQIVLHFQKVDGTTFEITPPPSGDDPDLDSILPELRKYFQQKVTEVDYVLTGINNRQSTDGNMLLTPKSFTFASTGTEGASCLSLFINVDQSGNSQGNPNPSFQPGDSQISPIPAGHTASIIISNYVMTTTFIKKRLEDAGFTVTVETQATGSLLSLKKNVSVIARGDNGRYIFSGYDYEGLNVNMQDHPLKLSIADGKASAEWSGSTRSEWYEYTAGSRTGKYGKVDIQLGMKKGPLAIGVSDDSVAFPEFKFERSDFTLGSSAAGCSFLDRIGGCMEIVPNFYKDKDAMNLQIPSISFALKGLDYFLETNLLEPSKQMIEVDSGVGLSTPRDFLIVGKVAAH
ncbi:hypothetical protein AB0C51_25500 [Streptomyces pathocidini]|uniref:hypothetical protein n=1 Tax=Streptomyces pathocidini TaxID=1650571 RepID=UPI0033C70C9C